MQGVDSITHNEFANLKNTLFQQYKISANEFVTSYRINLAAYIVDILYCWSAHKHYYIFYLCYLL
jgi:hypothetical protein